jgi:hypothetical protein
MEENEDEEDDNNIPDWAAGQDFADTLMEDADEEEINLVSLVSSTGPSRGRSQRSLLVSVGTTFRTDSWRAG